jgi:hypothetical protein
MSEIEALTADRRGFMLSSGAMLFAQPKLIMSPLPLLYGDGEHDDTAALQALFTGQPVKAATTGDTFLPLYKDGWAMLKGGSYKLSEPLKPSVRIYAAHARFISMHDGFLFDSTDLPTLPPDERYHAFITHCHFDLSQRPPRLPDFSSRIKVIYADTYEEGPRISPRAWAT